MSTNVPARLQTTTRLFSCKPITYSGLKHILKPMKRTWPPTVEVYTLPQEITTHTNTCCCLHLCCRFLLKHFKRPKSHQLHAASVWQPWNKFGLAVKKVTQKHLQHFFNIKMSDAWFIFMLSITKEPHSVSSQSCIRLRELKLLCSMNTAVFPYKAKYEGSSLNQNKATQKTRKYRQAVK